MKLSIVKKLAVVAFVIGGIALVPKPSAASAEASCNWTDWLWGCSCYTTVYYKDYNATTLYSNAVACTVCYGNFTGQEYSDCASN